MYNNVETIIEDIIRYKSVIVSMTNEREHYDISFTFPYKVNTVPFLYQGGIQTQDRSLIVSINGLSSFCFSLDSHQREIHEQYIMKKLSMPESFKPIALELKEIITYFKDNAF